MWTLQHCLFIVNSVENLSKFYLKSYHYTKFYINFKIA
ncbi:hypothetical protein ATCC51562_350 [Campylobacter concisus ATCC 51562]|uniref:Uncharacterized protein n=1 Tax=Campylobacter concisus ATCC 51562 TaxID=1242969 RepID=U2EQP8_9BACT|nr:hypothetical protein ATCC51562_350 [Campylobacter concisus ATCC 51562]